MTRRDTVGIRQLKNETSRILDEVRERRTDYVVTKRGEPVAVIRPWREDDAHTERRRRARAILERIAPLATRVQAAAGGRQAAAAVARQRR